MHPLPSVYSNAVAVVAGVLLVTLLLAFFSIIAGLRRWRLWSASDAGGLEPERIRWGWAEIVFSFALYFTATGALVFVVFGLLGPLLTVWVRTELPQTSQVDLEVLRFGAVPDVRRDPLLLNFTVHIAGGLLSIAGVGFVITRLTRSSAEALGFRGLPGRKDLFLVLGVFIGFFFPICFLSPLWIVVLESLGHRHELQDAVQSFFFVFRHGDLVAVGAIVVGAVLVAPVVEELLYRGVLHGCLSKNFGFPAAATISSLLFSAAHFNLGVSLPIFVLGFFLATLYERRGNLYEPILFHALFNASSLAQAALGVELTR